MQTSSTSGANTQAEQHLRAQLELLKNHDANSPSSAVSQSQSPCDQRNAPGQPAPARPSNGYDEISATAQYASRALANKTAVDAHIHPELRARHAAANMMPIAPPPGHSPGASAGPSNLTLDPVAQATSPGEDLANDGRKAKRELSQSKRAAQNRAAQRAFRQRKEGYIKKLEQQVRDYMDMEQTFKTMQIENYALREYVIHLQSRLLETQGEFPQPPPNVNLAQPSAPPAPAAAASAPPAPPPPPPPESGSGNTAVGTPLEAVAQAVAGLAAQEQMAERHDYSSQPPLKQEGGGGNEDTRSVEEINRQLQLQPQQSEDTPAPPSAA